MISRRKAVLGLVASTGLSSPAAAVVRTPKQTAGPFYPKVLPSESDADLVRIGTGPAATGQEIEITGRLLGLDGRPISGGIVELWQANAYGRYSNSRAASIGPLDPNFQGYGVVQTDDEGRYRFLTIKPGEYPGRTPHLHFKIGGPGFKSLTTQMYFADEPGNERDFVRKQIRDPEARESVTVAFAPSAKAGVVSGKFDIVVGQ